MKRLGSLKGNSLQVLGMEFKIRRTHIRRVS